MKLIRTTRLVRRQRNADVFCEIDLCQAPGSADRYLVNLRQGRAGTEWRESTRTPQPVSLPDAETLFALAVVDRKAQGFADPLDAPALTEQVPPAPPARMAPSATDATLLAALDIAQWKRLDQSQRNRLVWRIGERRVRAAVPHLVDLIERGDAMQDYCIAWAIGRCGDPGAALAMRELHARSSNAAVKRIALHAWLQLASAQEREQHAEALVAAWPAPLRDAFAREDAAWFAQLHPGSEAWRQLPLADWLEQLDQAALARPFARTVLLQMLRTVPLEAGAFRAVRHLYKAAELRLDAGLFGLLHHRFETTRSSAPTSRTIWNGKRWVAYAELAARPDSSVAYSVRTRAYLLRRGWRLLRRLGQDGDGLYVEMALGALLAIDDASAGKAYERDGRHYDEYSHWLLFNTMLRAQGPWRPSSSMLSWHQAGAILPVDSRQEAFPHLWDARPDALLRLMLESRCRGVHEFAARALADNAAWCAQLGQGVIRALLRSPYAATACFAFELCRRRFAPGVPDVDWLLLLLQSNLPEAQQYVVSCIAQDPLRYCADAQLVAAIACSANPDVRRSARLLCQVAATLPGQPQAIILQLLDWLDNCADLDDAPNQVPPIVDDLHWLLENPLRPAAIEAPYSRLLDLAGHRLSSVRTLACAWLLAHGAPPGSIPPALLTRLLQDPHLKVRSMGVRLFAALPDHLLAVQADLIHAFCIHPDAGMRGAIGSVIERLGPANAEFREALLPLLVDSLFRSETGEGMHADVVRWIAGPLAASPALDERALAVRLLAARSKGAQLLGAQLLPRFGAGDFTVAEWAAFGCNQNASVRQWVFAAYRAHPEQVRAELEAALRIFDTRFDDARAFAAEYFETVCRKEDWTPLLLVSLCDHPDPFTQRFGRRMITTHVEVEDAADFLFKLSQHPSPSMQLFVSSWLESASAGDADRLRRLESYFLTVLSQVHRGRVAKARVQAFLSAQATLSEDIAAFVARLYARQVVTSAIGDKAQYIEGLHAIRARWPGLAEVITIHRPEAR